MQRRYGTGVAGWRRRAGQAMERQAGRGRIGGPFTAGPGGSCVCPNCGATATHAAGQPCNAISCPDCGTKMTRG